MDLELVLKMMGGDHQTVVDEMQGYAADAAFFASNYGSLEGQFPNSYIGIHRGEIVAVASSVEDLIQEIEEDYNINNVYLGRTHSPRNRPRLILPKDQLVSNTPCPHS